jgi:hypothetical protein
MRAVPGAAAAAAVMAAAAEAMGAAEADGRVYLRDGCFCSRSVLARQTRSASSSPSPPGSTSSVRNHKLNECGLDETTNENNQLKRD